MVYVDTTLCDKVVSDLRQVCDLSGYSVVSSTNKTYRHNITEILLKMSSLSEKQATGPGLKKDLPYSIS
jgi:hypothetical protein